MRELDKVLDKNEKVFWEGQPKFWPYFMSGTTPTSIFGLVWVAFIIPFIFIGTQAAGTKGSMASFLITGGIFLIPFLLIGLWTLIGSPIYRLLLHKNLFYAITNKRVIIQKGVIGRDFQYIDFDQITNAEVNVGFWDKLIGTTSGSILLSSAGSFTYGRHGTQILRPYTLSNIDNPYEVFKLFKDVGHAVKTDIQFPNKYRPSKNPGYNTEISKK